MEAQDLKSVTLAELERNPELGPVWALNTTKGDKRGDLVLSVARLQGMGIDNLVIPATRVPLDLTMVVSRKQLLADNQFRRALGGRLLRLVDPEQAEKFVNEPGNFAEWTRASRILSSGGEREQVEVAESNVETFDDVSKNDTLPGPLQNIVDKATVLHTAGRLTEAEEDNLVDRMRNMGDIEEQHLRLFFDKLKGVSAKLRNAARKLAGRDKAPA